MQITVEYNQIQNCVVGKVIGTIEPSNVPEYTDKILECIRVHDCKRFLNDLREAEIKMTISDLYYVSAQAASEEFDRSWRRALLVKEVTQEIEFYEITANNKGLTLKVFEHFNEAMAWL